MEYTTYGKTNEKVSTLGMGGMRFSDEMSDEQAVEVIHRANELGVNYFDTAPGYCNDRSEKIYGKALASMPTDNWKIATKVWNELNADKTLATIENSLKVLGVDKIDFLFLWCIMRPEMYWNAKEKGRSIEGIIKAKERGLIEHIGVSCHTYSEGIKLLADDGLFEFIMVPYNALNFSEREAGLKYAKSKNIGTAAMNPVYGGMIPEYKDSLKIYPDSQNDPVADAMQFCLQSPYIDVTLSGFNSVEMAEENASYVEAKISEEEHSARGEKIKSSFTDLCTSCGYCLKHECPSGINMKSYMEIYNSYLFSGNMKNMKERHDWFTNAGPLAGKGLNAGSCIECRVCEEACTQQLNIIERLRFIDVNIEKEIKQKKAAEKAEKKNKKEK